MSPAGAGEGGVETNRDDRFALFCDAMKTTALAVMFFAILTATALVLCLLVADGWRDWRHWPVYLFAGGLVTTCGVLFGPDVARSVVDAWRRYSR